MSLLDDICYYWENEIKSRTFDENIKIKKVSSLKYFYTVMTSRGIQAMMVYRISHWLFKHHLKFLANILTRIIQVLYGIDISYEAELGNGILILHGVGLVIGRGVKMGNRVKLYQGVTLGVNDAFYKGLKYAQSFPKLGSNIIIGSGAKILGPVKIGNNVIIGANSVVTQDIPDNSIVAGIPGKVVKKLDK